MSKKGVIGLSVVLVLIILAFTGYRIHDYLKEKRAEDEYYKAAEIVAAYELQNGAFFDLYGYPYHMPYDKKYEYKLQAHIIFYTRATRKIIKLSDIEAFLSIQANPDGTPRIWKDDETGIIIDFVNWYKAGNSRDLEFYKSDLQGLLTAYYGSHPGCPYITLAALSPEQIIELDKKYLDPHSES